MAGEKMENLNDRSFAQKVENGKGHHIVDFGAAWCQPCKMLGVTLDLMVDEYKDVNFYYLDIEKAPLAAQKFAIRSVPTIVLFKDGSPVQSLVGNQPKAKIAKMISEN